MELYIRDPKKPERVHGPFDGKQLRHLADKGQVTRHHEVSLDQTKWLQSTKVKPPLFADVPTAETAVSDSSAGKAGDEISTGQNPWSWGTARGRLRYIAIATCIGSWFFLGWITGLYIVAAVIGAVALLVIDQFLPARIKEMIEATISRLPIQTARRAPCPHCGEQIIITARKCRFCHEHLDEFKMADPIAEKTQSPMESIPDSNERKGALYWYMKVWRNDRDFSGRACRREYWYFVLLHNLITMLLICTGLLSVIIFLLGLIPGLAVTVRRMHDNGRSGWMMLFPIINIILLVTRGTRGDNQFGRDPLAN